MEILELIYKKHSDWILIVQSFGCNKDTAEDIVMEAYIKLDKMIKNGVNIMYSENEVNYYYVYKTLSNLFIDLKRKESKVDILPIDEVTNLTESNVVFNLLDIYEAIEKEKAKLFWYDTKVFDFISDGESIQSLSDRTDIAYHRLRHSYTKVKRHLKEYYRKNFKDI
jgi:hypothetical protein